MSIYSEYYTGCITEEEFRSAAYREEMADRAAYEAQFEPNWKAEIKHKAVDVLWAMCDHCTDAPDDESACSECPVTAAVSFLDEQDWS